VANRPTGRNGEKEWGNGGRGNGLTGEYDVRLDWRPEDASDPMFKGPEGSQQTMTPSASSGPSILTAVQEQLGLKLESTKGPVECLVIDHVELPSEN
jgi:uncharacterized protein (TIGR03435 family)